MYQLDPDSMTAQDYANWQLAMQTENRDNFHNGEGGYGLVTTAYPDAKEMQKFKTREQNAKDSSRNAISPTSGQDGTVAIWAMQDSYLSGKPHRGIDIGAGGGDNSPSYSIIDGTIYDTYNSKEKDGINVNYVTVKDEDGNLVTSKHITPNPNLKVGDPVKAGSILGNHDLSGKAAGKCDGYHTHLEVTDSNKKEMDAGLYLMKKQPDLIWRIHPNLENKFKNRYPIEYNSINRKRWW